MIQHHNQTTWLTILAVNLCRKKSVIFSAALSVRRHTRIDTNSKWQLVHPGFHFRLPGVPRNLVFLRTTTRFSRARTFTSNYRKLKLSRIDFHVFVQLTLCNFLAARFDIKLMFLTYRPKANIVSSTKSRQYTIIRI